MLSAVAVALVAAFFEERRKSRTSPAVARYLDAIEWFGYQQ